MANSTRMKSVLRKSKFPRTDSKGSDELENGLIIGDDSHDIGMDSVLSSMKDMQSANLDAISTLNSSIRQLSSRMDSVDGRDSASSRTISFGEAAPISFDEGPLQGPIVRKSKPLYDRRSQMELLKGKSSNVSTSGGANDSDESGEESDEDEGLNVERVAIRLDGVEVYAVVSAITLATAVTGFEMITDVHSKNDWQKYVDNRDVYNIFIIAGNILCGSVGIVAGLHACIIFSLILMYGRTAIGLSHDESYDTFFQNTAMQRLRGFQKFLLSMYAFMVQVIILIESRCPTIFKPFAVGFVIWLLQTAYEDSQSIIRAAECIFQPRKGGKKRRRRTAGGVALHASSRAALALSTRQVLSRNKPPQDKL
mmetsp:Transcript_5980/g.8836  ORF Transcript_5980/g.8836 Transcript_5980/m.8836 type:complete len:367 (+) Transcript_5980:22-1122(+)